MRLEGLLFYVLVFILGPIVRGLLESGKTKKGWKEKQKNLPKPPTPTLEYPLVEREAEESRAGKPRRYRTSSAHGFDGAMPAPTDKVQLQRRELVETLSQISQKSSDVAISTLTEEKSQAVKDHCQRSDLGLESISGNDVLKGIVLTEILGPPKALAGGRR